MSWLNPKPDANKARAYHPTIIPDADAEDLFAKVRKVAAAEVQRRVQDEYNTGISINPPRRVYSDVEKIIMRLDIGDASPMGFDFIQTARIDHDKKVVFLVVGGKPMMIEDDEHLFPSDTLISQLRILCR